LRHSGNLGSPRILGGRVVVEANPAIVKVANS